MALARFKIENGYAEKQQLSPQKSGAKSVTLNGDTNSGLGDLAKLYFVPKANPFFGHRTPLPLLQSTNIAILDRLKNVTCKNTNQNEKKHSNNGKEMPKRPNSMEVDFTACDDLFLIQACWEVILSFMGDSEEEIQGKNQNSEMLASTIIAHDKRQNGRAKRKVWRKSSGNSGEVTMARNPVTKRPASMYVSSDLNGNRAVRKSSKPQNAFPSETLNQMTVLEKVHFLANVGIETPCFRDELICLILKQLVANSSTRSVALGWILLSLLLGCFAPSNVILPHVELFLRQQQGSPWGVFCLDKLTRTLSKGERKNPPCSLELQAAKTRQQMRIPVICMDQSVRTICTDSGTTAAEICKAMAAKTNLDDDAFGFALFLALDNKLAPLGHLDFHVMDAISQAERFSKLNDVRELWRIYFRRELFSPLDACCIGTNQMRIRLTYYQICGGVQSGEYQYKKPQDLALLMAHQYCVTHGLAKLDLDKVKSVCRSTLPPSAFVDGSKRKWVQMVYRTLKALAAQSSTSNDQLDTLDIMQQVVRYGSKSFSENFTKTFILSTFCYTKEPNKASVKSIMKLNHQQITVSLGGAKPRNDIITKPIFDEEVRHLKKAEIFEKSDEAYIRLTLQNKEVYEMSLEQRDELFEILKRYIKEVARNQ